MKILVCLKKTLDYNVNPQIAPDQQSIVETGVKMSTNPFCEIALEAAIQLHENNPTIEIHALCIGPESHQDILKRALAMGAHHAHLLKCEHPLSTLEKAQLLKTYIENHPYDLVLMGKQSIDQDHNHIPQMLGALLNWDTGLFCSKIILNNDHLTVEREIDEGLCQRNIQLPCILSSDLRLNQPRFISLPKIIQAKNKPVAIIQADSLLKGTGPKLTRTKLELPPARKKGTTTNDLSEFLSQLKEVLK